MNSPRSQYSPWVEPTPTGIYNQVFHFRLFNISYCDYGAFRNPPLPNPPRKAPALPPHLRAPGFRVKGR